MSGQTVSGGWDIYDGLEWLTNLQVNMGQSGFSPSDGYKSQSIYQYPSSTTYSYAVPSWYPVKADNTSFVGMSAYALVHEGSSSWDFWFYNQKYGL